MRCLLYVMAATVVRDVSVRTLTATNSKQINALQEQTVQLLV